MSEPAEPRGHVVNKVIAELLDTLAKETADGDMTTQELGCTVLTLSKRILIGLIKASPPEHRAINRAVLERMAVELWQTFSDETATRH